jgi:dihydrofolate reductase
MRRLITWNMTTLDGFFAGPDGSLDWFVFDDELERYIIASEADADTILFGRVTYQMMAAYWPGAEGTIATFMNSVRKYVFSRTLATTEWRGTTLVRDDAVAAVRRLKAEPGGDIFVFGSADFSATLMRHGLIDEYRIGLNPVILGRGIPLFKETGGRLKLRLVHSQLLRSGVAILHYAPAG